MKFGIDHCLNFGIFCKGIDLVTDVLVIQACLQHKRRGILQNIFSSQRCIDHQFMDLLPGSIIAYGDRGIKDQLIIFVGNRKISKEKIRYRFISNLFLSNIQIILISGGGAGGGIGGIGGIDIGAK